MILIQRANNPATFDLHKGTYPMKAQEQEIVKLNLLSVVFSFRHCALVILLAVLLLNTLNTKGQSLNMTPAFEMGSESRLSVGQASVSRNINYLLRVSDTDRGQLLTWSIASPPTVGTLSGFPAFALSGEVTTTPDAILRYQPTPGQTGNDEFTIEISDGLNSSVIAIRVNLLESEPPSDPREPRDNDDTNQSDRSRNISIVQQWNDIHVPFGTPYSDLVLPNGAGVTYTDGAGEFLPIVWCSSNFNGNASGEYLLTGDLILTPGSTNEMYLKAQIRIKVLTNLQPAEIILSDSILGPWPFADPDFPPNLFTTNDPDDDVHIYQLVDGYGDSDNCKFSVNYGILILKDRGYLKEQTKFYIRVRSTDSNNNSIEKDFRIYYLPKGNNGEEEGEGEEGEEDEGETVQIPNAFSPNGDGVNDLWVVPELQDYENVDIKVFDRSGILMFHTNNPKQGWDGRNPNGKIIAGAYFYTIKVGEINLQKQGVLIVLTN